MILVLHAHSTLISFRIGLDPIESLHIRQRVRDKNLAGYLIQTTFSQKRMEYSPNSARGTTITLSANA